MSQISHVNPRGFLVLYDAPRTPNHTTMPLCSLLQPWPAFLHPLPPHRSTSEASIQDTPTIQLSFYPDWNCRKDFYTYTWFVREEEDLYRPVPCWPPSPGAWLPERTKVGYLNILDTIFNLHLSNTNISNGATTSQGQRPDLNQHWAPRKWQWACAPCSHSLDDSVSCSLATRQGHPQYSFKENSDSSSRNLRDLTHEIFRLKEPNYAVKERRKTVKQSHHLLLWARPIQRKGLCSPSQPVPAPVARDQWLLP